MRFGSKMKANRATKGENQSGVQMSYLAVPRRFTAAFVLSLPLFLWLCFADTESSGFYSCQRECPVFQNDLEDVPLVYAIVERAGYAFTCGGVINESGDTAGKLQLPLGTVCHEQESSIGPGDVLECIALDYIPPSFMLAFALFLVAQMALAFCFAALKERGVNVHTGKRVALHIVLPILIYMNFRLGSNFGFPTVVTLWPLWILNSAALFVAARIVVEWKAPIEGTSKLSAFVRSLCSVFWALFPAIVFCVIRNAILPLSFTSASQWPFDSPFAGFIPFTNFAIALIYFFLFTVAFSWIFMAKMPVPTSQKLADKD